MRRENDSQDIAMAANQNIKEKNYWLKKLSGELIKSHFPYDQPGTRENRFQKERLKFRIHGETFSNLIRLSKGSDYALQLILVTTLVILLNKYTDNKDIIIGTPIYAQEIEGTFINTVLALRNQLAHQMTVRELLIQVRQSIMEAVENQNYPMETLLYQLNMEISQEDFPLFDNIILLENIHNKDYISPIAHHVNVIFSFLKTGHCLEGTLVYNSSRFGAAAVERIASHFQGLLSSISLFIDAPLAQIETLSEKEKRQLLVDFNDTETQCPGTSILHFFERNAETCPWGAAVSYEGNNITYKELNQKASRLAGMLRKKGTRQDQLVGILLERSPLMLESILATWKARGAYIPIDTNYPGIRVLEILKDSGAGLLLTRQEYVDTSLQPGAKVEVIPLDHLNEKTTPTSGNLSGDSNMKMNQLAYVIYTSGSTGKPRGVIVEHKGMINHIQAKVDELHITHRSIIVQNAPHTFDISVWQFFTALRLGARTVIYPDSLILDPLEFISRVVKDCVTILEVVPSYLSVLLDTLNKKPEPLVSIRYLLVTGETLKPNLVDEWFEKYPDIKMVNAYGPTEASDDITHYIMDKSPGRERIPIGRPLRNFSISIVDSNKKLVPVGVKGEICVSGPGVGRGYLNNPELTAEKFDHDLWDYRDYQDFQKKETRKKAPGKKNYRSHMSHRSYIYKTGDLGCWQPNGNIDFFGRKDHQVKIRGFRIELGEIENQLITHPQVKEAVVINREEENGNQYLCAYLVCSEKPDHLEISEYLSKRLPDYMVPVYFIQVEEFSITPNGKIDRKSLPEPQTRVMVEYIPPRNQTEEKLVDIWAGILGIESHMIGINDNFFQLGGHSLRVTALAARIHKELNAKIDLGNIFETPTIRELARVVNSAAKNKFTSIEPGQKKEYYRLSSAQKRLYILHQMDLAGTAYNIPILVVIEGEFDRERLETVFLRLIRRHESFRTSFFMREGEPLQKVHDEADFEIEYHAPGSREQVPHANTIKNFIRPFDPAKPPLLRVGVIREEENRHILMVDMHHIISDGVSEAILAKEFMAMYENKELPPLKIQYKDFAEWQNNEAQKEGLKKQEAYWLKEFSGNVPQLRLPTNHPGPAGSFESGRILFEIGSKETQKMKELAEEVKGTLFMILLAVINVFLSKICRQQDIVVGTPVANRQHSDLAHIIGFFVNSLALRNYPEPAKTFNEFLNEIREKTIQAFENQDYPFEELAYKLGVQRSEGQNPLFDVIFAFQNMEVLPGQIPEVESQQLSLKPYGYENEHSPFHLAILAFETGNTLTVKILYRTKLFKKETIERFTRYFKDILTSVLENQYIKLKDIKLSSDLLDLSLRIPQVEFSF